MCVLRVLGAGFDPRAWLRQSMLEPICIHAPGERLFDLAERKGKPRLPGFHVGVSNRSWDDWEGQAQEAVIFLRDHREELLRLRHSPDVECLEIDFPLESWPDAQVMHSSTRVPVELMEAAVAAGVEVILTVYVASGDETSEDDG